MNKFTKEEIEEKAMNVYYEILINRSINEGYNPKYCSGCVSGDEGTCFIFQKDLKYEKYKYLRCEDCVKYLGDEDSTDEFIKKVGYELILDGDYVLGIKKL